MLCACSAVYLQDGKFPSCASVTRFQLMRHNSSLDQSDALHRRCMMHAQGRCTDPPPASLGGAAAARAFASVGEEPWVAPRCVLITASRLFLVDRPGLWLDSLHIKIPYDADEDTDPVALIAQDGGSAYVSKCVVQSDGYANAIGLWAYRSPGLYVRGAAPRFERLHFDRLQIETSIPVLCQLPLAS